MDKLNDFLNEHIMLNTVSCCSNKNEIFTGLYFVCTNCGKMTLENDTFINPTFLNPKYQLSTIIGYRNKTKHISRLHKWANYDYKENAANKSYSEIEDICNTFGYDQNVINKACYLYNDIYINQKISCRNKIKRSVFIYCILKAVYHYSGTWDCLNELPDMLKKYKLTMLHYNKAINKLNDDDKMFLHNKFLVYKEIIKKNLNKTINYKDIVLKYNEFLKKNSVNKHKLSNNSIVLITFYILLDKDEAFFEYFKIMPYTVAKFLNQ